MELAFFICETEQQANDAIGYLKVVGARVDRKDNITDLSAHTVEGQAPGVSFPSEYHKMGKFILITGTWE